MFSFHQIMSAIALAVTIFTVGCSDQSLSMEGVLKQMTGLVGWDESSPSVEKPDATMANPSKVAQAPTPAAPPPVAPTAVVAAEPMPEPATEDKSNRPLDIDYTQFGACCVMAEHLLSKGGAVAKITAVDNMNMNFVVYIHEFGSTDTSYLEPDPKLQPKQQERLMTEVRSQLTQEKAAIVNGKAWYLIVNRAVFPHLPPLFIHLEDPNKTTKWRPYIIYVSGPTCEWNYLDWAIFEKDLPEGIRAQLR